VKELKKGREEVGRNHNLIMLMPRGIIKNSLFYAIALEYITGVFFPVVPYFFSSSSLIAQPLSTVSAGTVLALVVTMVSIVSGIPVKKEDA